MGVEPATVLYKELIKKGHQPVNGNNVWDIADRKLLYFTKELADGYLGMQNFAKYKKSVIDREVNLFKEQTESLRNAIGNEPVNLIDVCCGDGAKVVELLKALDLKENQVRYCPVNVSEYLVDTALELVKKENFASVAEYKPHVGDWDGRAVAEITAELRNSTYQRNVVLLLGSVIASFEINDYLFELSKGMFEGDYLIIGNGIRVGERLVHLNSYKDKAFRDWTLPLMKYMGFNEEEVEYDAQFGNSRVDFLYRVNADKTIKHDGHTINIKKGDQITVAYLYKFYEEELTKFCQMYFSDVELVKDEANEYALVICKK